MIESPAKFGRAPACRAVFRRGVVFLAGIAIVATALGQSPLPKAATGSQRAAATETNLAASLNRPDVSAKALEARLAEARVNLAAVAALSDAGRSNAPAGFLPQDIWARRTGLQRLVRIYEQQLSNAAELETTRTRTAEIVREVQAGFGDKPGGLP